MSSDAPRWELPTIPGLELPGAGEKRTGALELAIRVTLEELGRLELVKPVDAGRVALALELGQVLELKKHSGRLSTYGNDARVLMELLASFKDEADEVDDDLRATLERWERMLEVGDLGELVEDAASGEPENGRGDA